MNFSDLPASFAAAFNQDQRLITRQPGDGEADSIWGKQLLPQRVEGVNQAYHYPTGATDGTCY